MRNSSRQVVSFLIVIILLIAFAIFFVNNKDVILNGVGDAGWTVSYDDEDDGYEDDSYEKEEKKSKTKKNNKKNTKKNSNKNSKNNIKSSKNSNSPYYVKKQSELYDMLYDQIMDGATTLNVIADKDEFDMNDIFDVYKEILAEHPEIFWLTGTANGSGSIYGSEATYEIDLETGCRMSQLDDMKDELEKVADQIAKEAKQYKSEYEQVKYVHDSIIELCDYDESTFNTMVTRGQDAVDAIPFTAYGCLVDGLAVCEGYAKAFQMILNELGIECGMISGQATSASSSGPHAWNYARVDGEYVYIDVTWDDPVYMGGKPDEISDEYFCISLKEMSRDHFPDKGSYLP